MTDQTVTQNLERELEAFFSEAPLSDTFVNSLKFQLNSKINSRPVRKPHPLILRPVWIVLVFLLLALLTTTLIIGPTKVYAELRRLLGYIPGVGLVDSSAPIRVLAEQVEQTRDGVTITVTNATLTADRTHIEYRTFGVPLDAYPTDENVGGCYEQDYLLLADGTKLERMNDFPALPADVYKATLVIQCIPNTLPGAAPENWQIPLKFMAAPPDFTVMPVIEVIPTETETPEPVDETTEQPLDSSVSVTQIIETDTGYILVGRFAPSSQQGEWVQTKGMPVMTDANGSNVPYSISTDVDPGGNDIFNGGYGFAYQFDAIGVSFPITLTFNGVIISKSDPAASVEVPFDFGETFTPGQEWQPDLQFDLAGHTLRLVTIYAGSNGGYSFHFEVDPYVYGVGVEIKGVSANGGGGGGGGGLTDGKFSTSLSYAQPPVGEQVLVFSNLSVIGDPLTWQGTWSPESARTDLPTTMELPAGTCGNVNTIQSLAALPEAMTGKALFYEPMPDSDLWGLVLYDLDGANRTVIVESGNDGTISPDGATIAYLNENGFVLYDVATGVSSNLPSKSGYGPRWSNDGRQIAYVSGASEGVSIINIETGEVRQVSSMGHEAVIGWTPNDSHLIIAVMFSGGAAWQVRSVDAQTAEFEDLFIIEDGSRKELHAALSLDGQSIAYRGQNNSSVYLVKIDGSERHLLLDNPSVGTNGLSWGKNGLLAVSLGQTDTQIRKNILVDPATCNLYNMPGLTGILEGLYIP